MARFALPMTWKESSTPHAHPFAARPAPPAREIMVKEVSSKEEFDKIIAGSGDKLIAIDYSASWCG